MRAIIIDEKDAHYLLKELELEKFHDSFKGRGEFADIPANIRRFAIEAVHKRFRYIVEEWLQRQGARV